MGSDCRFFCNWAFGLSALCNQPGNGGGAIATTDNLNPTTDNSSAARFFWTRVRKGAAR
jgi:hypothetical protein